MPPEDETEFIIDPDLKFVSQAAMELLEYWEAKRGARPFPARKDIAPREIAHLLPWLHMFDVIEPLPAANGVLVSERDFRLRLLGTTMVEILGNFEQVGQHLSELTHHLFAERTFQALQRVLETRKPVRTYSSATAFPGKDFKGSEVCMAPLSSNGTDIDVVVGITSLLAKPGSRYSAA
ncbi:MAG: PAS domain-containing protein [Alphaproteobacteria bacterium]|nr:PAS domain-containing protein [Alphaproteobacteria bacterium]